MTTFTDESVRQSSDAISSIKTSSSGSNAFVRYLDRCGVEFDTAVSVLFGGPLGETVSLRVAIAERQGKWWGCWFCWFLNWAVQRHHCALQFETNKPRSLLTFIRAGVAFGFGLTALFNLIRELTRLIHGAL